MRLLGVGIELGERGAQLGCREELDGYFEHLVQILHDVHVLESQLFEVLQHERAGPQGILTSDRVVELWHQILLDHDDEVAPVVEANGLKDGEANLRKRAGRVRLVRHREEDDLILSEVLRFLDRIRLLPVRLIGVEEGDLELRVLGHERIAPGRATAGSEQSNSQHQSAPFAQVNVLYFIIIYIFVKYVK